MYVAMRHYLLAPGGENTTTASHLRDATIPDPFSSNALATPVWDHRLALEFPAAAVVLRGHDAG